MGSLFPFTYPRQHFHPIRSTCRNHVRSNIKPWALRRSIFVSNPPWANPTSTADDHVNTKPQDICRLPAYKPGDASKYVYQFVIGWGGWYCAIMGPSRDGRLKGLAVLCLMRWGCGRFLIEDKTREKLWKQFFGEEIMKQIISSGSKLYF